MSAVSCGLSLAVTAQIVPKGVDIINGDITDVKEPVPVNSPASELCYGHAAEQIRHANPLTHPKLTFMAL